MFFDDDARMDHPQVRMLPRFYLYEKLKEFLNEITSK